MNWTPFCRSCSSLYVLIIELDIPILTQPALSQELPLLPQQILDRDALVREDLQMIADQMSAFTFRTSDKRRTEMVRLFRDAVGGAVQALAAGEVHLVGRLLRFAGCGILGSRRRVRHGLRVFICERGRCACGCCAGLVPELGWYAPRRRGC